MKCKIFLKVTIIFAIIFLAACGAEIADTPEISGILHIDSSKGQSPTAPVFAAVSSTDDVDQLMQNPGKYIKAMVEVDKNTGTFSIDTSDTELVPGEEVFLFAFVDNNFTGGIPNPDSGDLLGFYTNPDSLKTTYTIGSHELANININRKIYSHDTAVIGLLKEGNPGNIILIAYAGNFNSTDFSEMDIDSIVGYKKIYKSNAPQAFSLKILPYGFNAPIAGVYIIALYDVNNNGIPDNGDMVGFASDNPDQVLPQPITLKEGITSCGTIDFKIEINDENSNSNTPEEDPYILNGSFPAPDGYDSDSKPVHIVIAKGDDPMQVFDDVDNLRLENFIFKTLPAGETSFSIELPAAKFSPEDNIFVIALWDKDYEGGMPRATFGDKIGLFHNKTNFTYTVKLNSENKINTISDTNSDGIFNYNDVSGYSFDIDRNYYPHNSVIKHKISKGDLSESVFQTGTRIITVAFYDNDPALREENTGVKTTWQNYSINYDKIIGTSKITIEDNLQEDYFYNMNILPAIHESIPVEYNPGFSINYIWVFAIIDENNNGKPDSGEKIGFFYKTITISMILGIKEEAPACTWIFDSNNGLQNSIRFSDQTYK